MLKGKCGGDSECLRALKMYVKIHPQMGFYFLVFCLLFKGSKKGNHLNCIIITIIIIIEFKCTQSGTPALDNWMKSSECTRDDFCGSQVCRSPPSLVISCRLCAYVRGRECFPFYHSILSSLPSDTSIDLAVDAFGFRLSLWGSGERRGKEQVQKFIKMKNSRRCTSCEEEEVLCVSFFLYVLCVRACVCAH